MWLTEHAGIVCTGTAPVKGESAALKVEGGVGQSHPSHDKRFDNLFLLLDHVRLKIPQLSSTSSTSFVVNIPLKLHHYTLN